MCKCHRDVVHLIKHVGELCFVYEMSTFSDAFYFLIGFVKELVGVGYLRLEIAFAFKTHVFDILVQVYLYEPKDIAFEFMTEPKGELHRCGFIVPKNGKIERFPRNGLVEFGIEGVLYIDRRTELGRFVWGLVCLCCHSEKS